MKTSHAHEWKATKSGKVQTCFCGRFRNVVRADNPAIVALDNVAKSLEGSRITLQKPRDGYYPGEELKRMKGINAQLVEVLKDMLEFLTGEEPLDRRAYKDMENSINDVLKSAGVEDSLRVEIE